LMFSGSIVVSVLSYGYYNSKEEKIWKPELKNTEKNLKLLKKS
jgi:hypothetical protein